MSSELREQDSALITFRDELAARATEARTLAAECQRLTSELRVREDSIAECRLALAARTEEVAALAAREDAQAAEARKNWVPPGHYYSPVVDPDEIRSRAATLFAPPPAGLPGIDLNVARQRELYEEFARYYAEQEFPRSLIPGHRYYSKNDWFPYFDAFALHGMIRHARPRRLIEVGSGFSTCVSLDAIERHMPGEVEMTFVEPNPERLLSLLTPEEVARIRLLRTGVQDVPLAEFERLAANDILFIDSTHVSKAGSDVNFLFFDVLPVLKPGVLIHVHDIFFPFEYPKEWLFEGRSWNENYLVRAFLTHNPAYQIEF
ncbi:MAG: class I SAM-dependent methyltransferase, partial [Fimbriiglobus sp.]